MNIARSFAFAALAALAFAGCQHKDETAATAEAGKTVRAPVATLAYTTMALDSSAPGTVISDRRIQVASRLMGYIRELPVHEGQMVKKGQPLFTIDPADIMGGVNQARAGLAQAEAALADATLDYERFGALYKDESIPKMQFDKIKLQYQVAQAQVAAARAGFATANAQLAYAEVKAPIDGLVVQKMASVGDLAAPGHPIVILEDPGSLQVQTQVSADVFQHIKSGDDVAVSFDGVAAPVAGKIARVVAAADPMSRSYTVKIDLPPDAGVKSGSFGRVSFVVGQRQGLRLPASAVLNRAGIVGVFVVDGQGLARFRMVRVGEEAGDGQVEILAGLNAGEKVVLSDNAELQSGDRVEAVSEAGHG